MMRRSRSRSLLDRERAELEWWRHFHSKCWDFPLRVGEPLLGCRFDVIKVRPFAPRQSRDARS